MKLGLIVCTSIILVIALIAWRVLSVSQKPPSCGNSMGEDDAA